VRRLFLILALAASAWAQCPTAPHPSVCLTWQESNPSGNEAVSGFNIYRSSDEGQQDYTTPLNSKPLPPSQLWYLDTAVTAGATYYYTAVALGTGTDHSSPSDESTASIPEAPPPPQDGNTSDGWWKILGRVISH
jgi:hypothetical protein